ncbi:YceI family protein [Actinoallomurus spadix]|uniref:YceI family protein n=1 Tax=Actinoallomurus spadix TaxID=79912 RepID=A0ABP3GUG3_9ACTN|nr:YceI family protein [Actinoallomurus spadix]MCO5989547.1 YceI family protein [Actinoallomurus spadix]
MNHANAAVTARIVAPGGWPVEHAILTLTDATGRQAGRTAVDTTGRAVLEGIAPGVYTLIVSAAGHQPEARTAVVGPTGLDLGDIEIAGTGGRRLPEAGVWDIDPVHSSVQVRARHIGLVSVRGRISDFSGEIVVTDPVENSTVEVTLRAASIDTGNSDRDTHLRSKDFLYVDEYPDIAFRSKGLRRLADDRWAMDGELTIRGTTRPVTLDTTYLGTGPDPWGGVRCGFHAVTELNRDEFAVDWNQAVRVGIAAVGGTLLVELDIELVKR